MAISFNHVTNTLFSSTGVVRVDNTGAFVVPVGTTAQRPGTPADGMIRYNTTTGKLEARIAGSWTDIDSGGGGGGGSADSAVAFAVAIS